MESRRLRRTAVAWAALCMVLLAVFIVVTTTHKLRDRARTSPPPPPPQPLKVAADPAPELAPSRPVRLAIPRIKVRTSLLTLGKNNDGTLEVPSAARVQQAGWYRFGASPGALGPAVIAGHVDSKTGPAVFARLGELRKGDLVQVLRRDRRTAVFQIDSVERVPKARFPTHRVYGALDYPGLRLITCGGGFNPGTRQYTENVIAYGHLVAVPEPPEPAPKLKPVRTAPGEGPTR